MQNEFRGSSIEETVNKVFRKHECKRGILGPDRYDNSVCENLKGMLDGLLGAIERHESELDRLGRKINFLKEDLEREAAMRSSRDEVSKILQVAGALSSLFLAVRAVQIGVRAYRAASGIARTMAAGETLASAVGSVSIIDILGFGFLEPSTEQKIKNAIRETDNLVKEIGVKNKRIQDVLGKMIQNDCFSNKL